MNKTSIYRVTLKADGRLYIGQTRKKRASGPAARWNDHVLTALSGRSKTYFHNAIRLYGRDAFIFEVIEECDPEAANDRERYYIALYRSNEKPFGFNMSPGGDGGQNSRTPEVRRRIAESKRGVPSPCSPEKALAISKAKLAQKLTHSEATRKLISERRRGIRPTDEVREKLSRIRREQAVYKLAPEQVEDVLKLLCEQSDSALAMRFGVSRKMIWRIRHGKYLPTAGR